MTKFWRTFLFLISATRLIPSSFWRTLPLELSGDFFFWQGKWNRMKKGKRGEKRRKWNRFPKIFINLGQNKGWEGAISEFLFCYPAWDLSLNQQKPCGQNMSDKGPCTLELQSGTLFKQSYSCPWQRKFPSAQSFCWPVTMTTGAIGRRSFTIPPRKLLQGQLHSHLCCCTSQQMLFNNNFLFHFWVASVTHVSWDQFASLCPQAVSWLSPSFFRVFYSFLQFQCPIHSNLYIGQRGI